MRVPTRRSFTSMLSLVFGLAVMYPVHPMGSFSSAWLGTGIPSSQRML